MNRRFALIVTIVIAAAAVLGASVSARAKVRSSGVPRYTLQDLGTLGGPNDGVAELAPVSLANRLLATGTADTATPSPYGGNDPVFNNDPYVQHAFLWKAGRAIDLGALGPHPVENSSTAFFISPKGNVTGSSENGAVDPLTKNPEIRAVLWSGGKVTNLGTLGGYESAATAVNDKGQAVGAASNKTPDKFPMGPAATQMKAFLWQSGKLHNLGTLGGTDSTAWLVNNRGQVAGLSYVNSKVNKVTGQPTTYFFIWQHGKNHDKMRNIGNLGGSVSSPPNDMNSSGEFVGASDLKGDKIYHAALWNGRRLLDLGTLGGDNGSANFINDAGVVVGQAGLPGSQTHHAFLWRPGQHGLVDLGAQTGDACSGANDINSKGQIVGRSSDCNGNGDASLWEGGHVYNLNALIASSVAHLDLAENINNAGTIYAQGTVHGNTHEFVLIPKS